ncbi:hypothetical protein V9L05_24010 (plasmid) [Bernardetia sp. Wsw4-3y2]|uniref:Imm43 family immunity protein n=1 Tax=Bernardetia sp. Wsw4-3y2 TaxID=3127471 RepID=UPI0030CAAD2A
MKNWLVGMNKTYYDLFLGEEFNTQVPDQPIVHSKWKTFNPIKHGTPILNEYSLPKKTIAVIAGGKKSIVSLYLDIKNYWVLTKSLYEDLSKRKILPLHESSDLSIYNYKQSLISEDYQLLRFYSDQSDWIDTKHTKIEKAESSIPKVYYELYSDVHLKNDASFFMLINNVIYKKTFFCEDELRNTIFSECKDIEYHSFEDYNAWYRQRHSRAFAKK